MRAWRTPEARTDNGRWSRAWLITVARRIAIDGMRAAKARPAEMSDEHIETRAGAVDQIERAINAREVRAAIATLPNRQKPRPRSRAAFTTTG